MKQVEEWYPSIDVYFRNESYLNRLESEGLITALSRYLEDYEKFGKDFHFIFRLLKKISKSINLPTKNIKQVKLAKQFYIWSPKIVKILSYEGSLERIDTLRNFTSISSILVGNEKSYNDYQIRYFILRVKETMTKAKIIIGDKLVGYKIFSRLIDSYKDTELMKKSFNTLLDLILKFPFKERPYAFKCLIGAIKGTELFEDKFVNLLELIKKFFYIEKNYIFTQLIGAIKNIDKFFIIISRIPELQHLISEGKLDYLRIEDFFALITKDKENNNKLLKKYDTISDLLQKISKSEGLINEPRLKKEIYRNIIQTREKLKREVKKNIKEELELKKEKELEKKLDDLEDLIKKKQYKDVEDTLSLIIQKAKKFHLNGIENRAKSKYSVYRKFWKEK